MAPIFSIGPATGSTAEFYQSGSQVTIVSDAMAFGGYALQFTYSGTASGNVLATLLTSYKNTDGASGTLGSRPGFLFPNTFTSPIYGRFKLKLTSTTSNTSLTNIALFQAMYLAGKSYAPAWQLGFNFTTGNNYITLRLTGPGGLSVVGTTHLIANTAYTIEFGMPYTSGNAYYVKIDDATEISGTLGSSVPSAIKFCQLGGSVVTISSGNVKVLTADWLMDDTSAPPKDGGVIALVPTSNGTYTTATPAGTGSPATIWQAVSDLPNDGDVSYVSSASTLKFTCNSSGGLTGSINAVLPVSLSRSTTGTGTVQTLWLRSGSTDYSASVTGSNGSYSINGLFFVTDPDTGSAWTLSGVNAAQMGAGGQANICRVTAAYLLVDYTPGGGGGGAIAPKLLFLNSSPAILSNSLIAPL